MDRVDANVQDSALRVSALHEFQVTEVQKALKGADYPMDGDQLAELAGKNGAGEDLNGALRGVGEVEGPNGVMRQLKSHLGGRPGDP